MQNPKTKLIWGRRFGLACQPWLVLLSLLWLMPVPGWSQHDRRTALVEAIEKTRDAIVNIQTLRSIPAAFTGNHEGQIRGLGTGVFIDPRGLLITNYHVVEEVQEIEVITWQRERFTARVLRHDQRNDLALLQIVANPWQRFHFLSLAQDNPALLGEETIAIGNPYGLENSISRGIVSSVDRRLTLPNGHVFKDLIQTDASINPGNSGGPLLDINGLLLGINVAIRADAQGIGFAIPVRTVRKIVEEMLETDSTVPLLDKSIRFTEWRPTSQEEPLVRVQNETVVRIQHLPNESVAFRNGFRAGDELLSINNQPVKSTFDFKRIVWGLKPGTKITCLVRRSGREEEIEFEVNPPPLSQIVWENIGIRVEVADANLITHIQRVHDRARGGLIISEVAPGSPADVAKLRTGDILIGLDRFETIELPHLRYIMMWEELPKRQPLTFWAIRKQELKSGTIAIPVWPYK